VPVGDPKIHLSKVLVAVDFSDESKKALQASTSSRSIAQAVKSLRRFVGKVGKIVPDIDRAIGPRLHRPDLHCAGEHGVGCALRFVAVPRHAGEA